jgi:hypothetical protein
MAASLVDFMAAYVLRQTAADLNISETLCCLRYIWPLSVSLFHSIQ